MKTKRWLWFGAFGALLFACSSQTEPSASAGAQIAASSGPSTAASGGTSTAGAGGAPSSSSSAGGGQAGGPTVPLDGFGAITGTCGVLEPADLQSQSSAWFSNTLDFGRDTFAYRALSTDGKKVHDDGNLGGSSLYSEVMAFEVLHRCELASLIKTESEIVYDSEQGKKTDLLVRIDGLDIGVSVTRAVGFPKDAPYTAEQAKALLDDKLSDVLLSSANVASQDAWEKQILLILAYADQHRDALEKAWLDVDVATRANTLVWVTVTDGADGFVY